MDACTVGVAIQKLDQIQRDWDFILCGGHWVHYTVLCKSLELPVLSLYFARKVENSCSDLLKRANLHGNSVFKVKTKVNKLEMIAFKKKKDNVIVKWFFQNKCD